jgi:L-malate glycosyltransferase
LNLLYLHQFDLNFVGGSGVYLRALREALKALQHNVEVVAARPDPYGVTTYPLSLEFNLTFGPEKRAGEIVIDELTTAELNALSQRIVALIEAEVFKNKLPDLILANHISLMAEVARRLKEKYAIPYRIISHGTDTELLSREQRYRELFEHAVEGADRVFTISRYVAEQIAENAPPNNVKVIGGAVDRNLFYPNGSCDPKFAAVTYVGRLVTEKGLWILLEAFGKLPFGVDLNLVGEGPLFAEMKAKAACLENGARIRFFGFLPQDEIREILVNSAILVMPSLWQEPLGLAALEAMACGVPVVASSVGGIPEIVRDGIDGLLLPPGDAGALAQAINLCLANEPLQRKLRSSLAKKEIPTYLDLAQAIVQ